MPSPPPIPNNRVVLFDCLSGDVHQLLNMPLVLGATADCDIQLGAFGFLNGRVVLARSGKQLRFAVEEGEHDLDKLFDNNPFCGLRYPRHDRVQLDPIFDPRTASIKDTGSS